MTNEIQRNLFYLCDAIIMGENEGPLEPNPNYIGILIAGVDPLMIDLSIAELLNFDYKKIPQIIKLFGLRRWKITNFKPQDLTIYSNNLNWNNKKINEIDNYLMFKASKGWRNNIEK